VSKRDKLPTRLAKSEFLPLAQLNQIRATGQRFLGNFAASATENKPAMRTTTTFLLLSFVLFGCPTRPIPSTDGGGGGTNTGGAAGGAGANTAGMAGTGGLGGSGLGGMAAGGIGGGGGGTNCSGSSQCASGAACVAGACTVCTTGQTVCPNACSTLSNDGNNCGACGHSCLGGVCSNGSCLPVTLAKIPATSRAAGLAVNSTTVFTTVPGNGLSSWSLYGVAKTAVNASPSPILTAAAGNNTTGFLGANDTVLFAETGYNSPGGNSSTMISCSPTSCASTQQNWYTASGSVSACDPSVQECFVELGAEASGTFQYAKEGTVSQTSPQSFSPVLTMASGVGPAATDGYLYMAGPYGVNPNPSYAVLQRVSEDGTSQVTTLADLGLAAQYALTGPLVVTGTRVYVVGADINANTTGLISVSLPNGVGNSAPPFLAGTTISSNNWLAAWGDDEQIFFASSANQWVACPASGCTGAPTVLADASSALPYLVGDMQAIYWINTITDATTGYATGFSVMKVAR
jgi:hypothetical protein